MKIGDDHVLVLKALTELPFNVGKKLLIDFLRGDNSHESIDRNRLDKLDSFGSMSYSKDELTTLIDRLIYKDMIRLTSIKGNTFWKVLEITPKGVSEIHTPTLDSVQDFSISEKPTVITEKDQQLFSAFGSILKGFNDEQKKAIISEKEKILCVAGAGSGKTTVLTRRIDFLLKYRSINPKKILAITFTRKARQEMIKRLQSLGHHSVQVETFNSFCEKILKKHNDLMYERPVSVISYRDKIRIVSKAISSLGTNMSRAISTYFTPQQMKGRASDQLVHVLVNDCFFIRDYFKSKNRKLTKDVFNAPNRRHQMSARMMFGICSYIDAYMTKNGLRDFSDQLIDAIKLFKKVPDVLPEFDHILVDEYQDVNSTQIELINILKPSNLFCVGDPRQSIYGWRGSDVKYIIGFTEKYPDAEIISLTKNYRSSKYVVQLCNEAIRKMRMPDLEAMSEEEKDVRLLNFKAENAEFEFVIQRILSSNIPRKEIFVLARTNRQLSELSVRMAERGISHVIRNDEVRKSIIAKDGDITLATIHAIKGLEAEMVFVIGANCANFPCKGSDHPVIDMIKVDAYDKEAEERRLFYVALSRAKKSLYLSYTGKKPTSFISTEMEKMIEGTPQKGISIVQSNDILSRLKDWRKELSQKLGVPAYIVMHDTTLIDIALKMPTSLAELENVRGMGPSKVMKYGEDILQQVTC